MKRMTLLLAISLFSVLTLSGCETVEGFGRDVEKAGEAIKEKASKTRNY